MKIKSLELKNFRNYLHQEIKFDEGLCVLHGKNASGKTNMLESIYLSSIFHSPRTTKDKEMIKIGQDKAIVKIEIEKKYRKHQIILQIDEKGKKKVLIDGIPIKRAGELLGILGIVYFSPDELKMVKESPQERRRFLDIGLSQQQKNYFLALQRYNKIVKQKNNLLKESRFNNNIDDMLDIWDIQLAEQAEIIIRKRIEYIKNIRVFAKEKHNILSGQSENLEISYESDIKGDIEKQNIYKILLENRQKDIRLGYSSVGPHREDIKILIDNKDSRKFASQGQQRTIALALKLAEVEMFKEETGETPVLLLDDVLSELDEERQKMLIDMTKDIQTILTCTEFELNYKAQLIKIENGKIVEIKKNMIVINKN